MFSLLLINPKATTVYAAKHATKPIARLKDGFVDNDSIRLPPQIAAVITDTPAATPNFCTYLLRFSPVTWRRRNNWNAKPIKIDARQASWPPLRPKKWTSGKMRTIMLTAMMRTHV